MNAVQDHARFAPAAAELLHTLFHLAPRRQPGEIRSPDETGCGVQQHETRAALRIRCGEEHAERPGVAHGEEHGTFRAGRFEDRTNVVHSRFEGVGAG